MRVVALLLLVACGPEKPLLANAPHPDNAAVAGGAAAAAAAMTLADPDAATRGKPEQPETQPDKAPVEVKDHVPSAVFDRLDHGGGAAAPAAKPASATAPQRPAHAAPARPLPKLPSPEQAAEHQAGSPSP